MIKKQDTRLDPADATDAGYTGEDAFGWNEGWARKPDFVPTRSYRAWRLRTMAVCLLSTMVLGACVSFGHTPVKITIEGELKGRPFQAERNFACEAYTRYDAGCPGCKAWRHSQSQIAIPLSGNSGVVVHLITYCTRQGKISTERLSPRLAWADDLSNPNHIETYDIVKRQRRWEAPFPIDGRATWLAVAVSKGDPGPSRATELDRQATWFPSGTDDQKRISNPRVLACFLAVVHEKVAWSKAPELVDMVGEGGSSRILPIFDIATFGKIRGALPDLGLPRWRTGGYGWPPPSYRVPLNFNEGYWVPDFSKRGVGICRYVGIDDPNLDTAQIVDGRLNFVKWYRNQTAKVDEVEIPLDSSRLTFVSSIGTVVDFKTGRSFDDHQY